MKNIDMNEIRKGGAKNALVQALIKEGFTVMEDGENSYGTCYFAEITDASGFATIEIYFGGNAYDITARITKINRTHKWYYEKTLAQMLSIIRKCMEGYDWTKPTKAEEPEMKEEEETMETKITVTTTDTIPTTTENMKEDTTMKTTETTTFELGEATYTMNPKTNRYSKTENGKTKRIGKAEYDEAKIAHDLAWAAYEQEKLDAEPSRVEVENDLDKPAVLNEFGCVDCSKCNCDKCVHRDCMRRNPKTAGGLGECPRLDNGIMGEGQKIAEEEGIELAEAELEANIRKEAKKAARKPRKSKDIAYEGHGKTLTAKQVDFLQEMVKTDVWDGFDSMIWTDVLCDEIGGQFTDKPMTVGAMVSTLCEKGLAERSKGEFTDPTTGRTRKSTYMAFTGLGQKIAEELGI